MIGETVLCVYTYVYVYIYICTNLKNIQVFIFQKQKHQPLYSCKKETDIITELKHAISSWVRKIPFPTIKHSRYFCYF